MRFWIVFYIVSFFIDVTLLTAFSMKRNWYRLVAETKPDKETRDMRCLHAIKTISMFNITSGHSFWYMISIPFSNPIFVEKVNSNLYYFIVLIYCVVVLFTELS